VVAKRSQRTLSLGISLTTHPSLVFLIGLLFFFIERPLINHLPLPFSSSFPFPLQQYEAEWLAENLLFVEIERMIFA